MSEEGNCTLQIEDIGFLSFSGVGHARLNYDPRNYKHELMILGSELSPMLFFSIFSS